MLGGANLAHYLIVERHFFNRLVLSVTFTPFIGRFLRLLTMTSRFPELPNPTLNNLNLIKLTSITEGKAPGNRFHPRAGLTLHLPNVTTGQFYSGQISYHLELN